jgi:hypothetical protein
MTHKPANPKCRARSKLFSSQLRKHDMRRSGRLLAVLLCCVSSSAFSAELSRSEPTSRPSAGVLSRAGTLNTPTRTCTVSLHNRDHSRVTLEVRIGDDPDPEANRSLGSKRLGRGKTWTIQSQGEDVWYRSAAEPYRPGGRWTSWVHRPCYPNRSESYHENI